MTSAVANLPIEETYKDVEKLIYHTVHKFVKRCGGDFEEYVAEANTVFLKVYKIYDPTRGAFSTLLVTCIIRHLTDLYRDSITMRKLWGVSIDADFGNGSMADKIEGSEVRKFDKLEFGSELTEAARTVLDLVLEAPGELEAIALGKGGEPRNWRSTIRNHLYDLGWTAGKIAESFEEIRSALM